MSQKLPSYLTITSTIQQDLSQQIAELDPDKVAILVDENTKEHCLPALNIAGAVLIEIQSGEEHKTLSTCEHIWGELTRHGFTRKSLLINLGGGVIGDMGGFAASTFKRGIAFINVPTTLLSQVDASIGGKLGVDFNGLKNHIGLFREPNHVLIHTDFLQTLPEREVRSGYAEILKHALIWDQQQWAFLKGKKLDELTWSEVIPKSVAIKNEVVNNDPTEKGLRKILNFGHTLGHAIETHYLNGPHHLLHGEAIALGMILEAELSSQMGILSKKEKEEVERCLLDVFHDVNKNIPTLEEIDGLLLQDKKNTNAYVSFSLIDKIGACSYDVKVDDSILQRVVRQGIK